MKLKFNDTVYGFKQEPDPKQRPFISNKSYQTGTILVPYKGTIIGIKEMVNGDIFYTIEGKEINIFNRKFAINTWEHTRKIEIESIDIFYSENDLAKGINKKVDEFKMWAKAHLEKINLNKE